MGTHYLMHGQPPTKIKKIFKKLKKLQPNKEFDTSAAQLVEDMFLFLSTLSQYAGICFFFNCPETSPVLYANTKCCDKKVEWKFKLF